MTPPKKRGFLLTRALTVAMLMSVGLPLPARAQFGGIVYDPSNYAQNVLTAARSLPAVNNQIRQIENQAQSLINQAKNLTILPVSPLSQLQPPVPQTRHLPGSAQPLAYHVQHTQPPFPH